MSSLAISGRRRDSKLATALLEALQGINQRFPYFANESFTKRVIGAIKSVLKN
jgi:hypothetical protein